MLDGNGLPTNAQLRSLPPEASKEKPLTTNGPALAVPVTSTS